MTWRDCTKAGKGRRSAPDSEFLTSGQDGVEQVWRSRSGFGGGRRPLRLGKSPIQSLTGMRSPAHSPQYKRQRTTVAESHARSQGWRFPPTNRTRRRGVRVRGGVHFLYSGGTLRTENNRAELSHRTRERERQIQRCKLAAQAQTFLAVHAAIQNALRVASHGTVSRRSTTDFVGSSPSTRGGWRRALVEGTCTQRSLDPNPFCSGNNLTKPCGPRILPSPHGLVAAARQPDSCGDVALSNRLAPNASAHCENLAPLHRASRSRSSIS